MNRPFSHSSLSTFEQCPARFKFAYLEKIYKPYEGIESFVGRRVHEAIEFLYKEQQKGRKLYFDAIEDCYLNNWKVKFHEGVKVIKPGYKIDFYKHMGLSCLSKYFRGTYKESLERSVQKRKNEYSLIFKLDDDDDFEIKGIIDRLDCIVNPSKDESHWEIHDYKTSNRLMSQSHADHKDRQLALYQIGLQKIENKEIQVDLIWHFLQFGKQVKSKRTPQQLKKLKGQIQNLVFRIKTLEEKGEGFFPKESPLCNWCFYWEECEAKVGHNPVVNSKASG